MRYNCYKHFLSQLHRMSIWVCSSVGRAAVSKAAGRGFESLRTRFNVLKKGTKMAIEANSIEIKKPQQMGKPQQVETSVASTQSKQASDRAGQISEFFSQTKAEFGKISWTSPAELRAYTKIVVGTTFVFGMGIYLMDLGIQLVLNTLGIVMRFLGG